MPTPLLSDDKFLRLLSALEYILLLFNLSVSGTFANNLHPKSLTISFGAVGPNQTTVILETLAPPYSTYIPVSSNLSPYTLGKLVLVGPGYTSVTTKKNWKQECMWNKVEPMFPESQWSDWGQLHQMIL